MCDIIVKLTVGQNWFDGQVHVWDEIVRPIIQEKDYCRALEVGTWEGGSACWILSELCSGSDLRNQLVCIDHFDMMNTEAGRNRWELFNNNLRDTGLIDRTRVLTQFSTPALFKLMNEQITENSEGFNLIYIDASHRSDDTLLDAEMAWRLGSEGCLIIFDDYEWDQAPQGTIEHPKNGIDAFLSAHCNEFVLLSKGYQVIIQKTVHLRVGFL